MGTNLVNDPSVKKIIVPPNGTVLSEGKPESPNNQKGFYTMNAEIMIENMVQKGNSKQRPPSSASRFNHRLHSMQGKESALSKQISDLTKTNAQPFQVLP